MKNILKNFAAFGIAPLVALGLSMGGALAAEGANPAEPGSFPDPPSEAGKLELCRSIRHL